MKTLLKTILLLVVVLTLAIVLVPIFFKKPLMEKSQQFLNENLKAKVEFSDFGLSLLADFPRLQIQVDGLSVVGLDAFAKDTLVAADRLAVSLDLKSVLFAGPMKVRLIEADRLDILLKTLEDSSYNYDIAPTDTLAEEEPAAEEEEASDFVMALEHVRISQGRFRYDDRLYATYMALEGWELELSGDMTASQTDLDFSTQAEAFTFAYEELAYIDHAKLDWKALFFMDFDKFRFEFKENLLSLNDLPMTFSGWMEMPEDDIDMDLKFGVEQGTFRQLLSLVPALYRQDFAGLQASGSLGFDGYAKGTYSDGLMPAYGVALKVENGQFQYPDLPEKMEDFHMDMTVDAQAGTGEDIALQIKDLRFKMAQNPFALRLIMQMSATDTQLDTKAEGKLALASLSRLVPMDGLELQGIFEIALEAAGKLSSLENEQYQDFKMGGSLGLRQFRYQEEGLPETRIDALAMDFAPEVIDLRQLDMRLGQSDLSLTGTLDNLLSYMLSDQALRARFDLRSENFDLNEWMSEEEAQAEEIPADTAALEVVVIDPLYDFLMTAEMGRIRYDKMDIEDFVGTLRVKDGQLSFEESSMKMLGGLLQLSGAYDTRDPQAPRASFDLGIQGFDLPKAFATFNTLAQIAPLAEHSQGRVSSLLKMETLLGPDLSPVLASLEAKGSFSSDDLMVESSDFLALLAEKTKNPAWATPRLKDLQVAFQIHDGRLELEPFDLDLGGTPVEVGGKQMLDGAMDYYLSTTLETSKAAGLFENFSGNAAVPSIDLRLLLGGTVSEPKLAGVESQALGGLAGRVEDAVRENLSEEAQRILDAANLKAQALLDTAKAQGDRLVRAAERQAAQVRQQAGQAADQAVREAETQGQRLVDQASNPVAKAAARKTAEELVRQAQQKATTLSNEADTQANGLVSQAQRQAGELNTTAQRKADQIRNEAQEQVDKL